jgi:hypothetical protein
MSQTFHETEDGEIISTGSIAFHTVAISKKERPGIC